MNTPYKVGQKLRLTKFEDSGASVVVEGWVAKDDEGDLFVPHATYLTNTWDDNFEPENGGWNIEIIS